MINVFVPDAHALGNIAAIRSLGRAGYKVHACSYKADALGFKSNYVTKTTVQPDYSSPDYLSWLVKYLSDNDIKMIVPSESILLAVRPRFDDFKHLLPVNQKKELLYRLYRKHELVKAYQKAPKELGMMTHHPDSSIVDLTKKEPFDIPKKTPHGYYIKFEGALSGDKEDDYIKFAENEEEVKEIIAVARSLWKIALIQSGCTGRQIGVSILMDKGEALAVSCVRDKYEKPHNLGNMSLRECSWSEKIVEDAIKRLKFLGFEGCAMVEYRQEDGDLFNLIEINARYWNYLHLDIKSGIDFPKLQAEWFLEGTSDFTYLVKPHMTLRDTWPGELICLRAEFKNPSNGGGQKLKIIAEFFFKFFKYDDDLNLAGDRKLYFINLFKFAKNILAL